MTGFQPGVEHKVATRVTLREREERVAHAVMEFEGLGFQPVGRPFPAAKPLGRGEVEQEREVRGEAALITLARRAGYATGA